jgi:type II secretory pathway component PulC
MLFAAACGASKPPNAPRESTTQHAEPDSTPAPVTSLKRATIREAIAKGLGVFLQNVTVEDWPVMHDGKFYGFKIRTLNSTWRVDLKPGDVILRVNGIVPEHPEEADAALRSLEKAASLKIDFERDGKAKTLELPIVD